MKILKQRLGKLCDNGKRVYIEDEKLALLGMVPGNTYGIKVDQENNKVELISGEDGNAVIPKNKKGKVIPVVDTKGSVIKQTLSACDYVKITFVQDGAGRGRVIIQGFKNTSSVKRESVRASKRKLSCISFCAGTGVSSSINKLAGFEEIAACEYNAKGKSADRYSEVYSLNHPDTVMYNIPMEKLSADDLPDADMWVATLDCTEFSKIGCNREEKVTLHLYMHFMRLFWEMSKERRPSCVLIENVEEFEKIAGTSLSLAFKDEGYHVKSAKINSLDYGSRTERERYFFVATIYEGFEFPLPTGRLTTPLTSDGVITVDTLEWMTADSSATLKYYIERTNELKKQKVRKNNHLIKAYDITRETHIGTITKTSASMKPENLIAHPEYEGMFAYITDEKQLRYLHGIPSNLYLGKSKTAIIEAIGQGICCKTYFAIIKKLHDFLSEKMTRNSLEHRYEQLSLVF